MYVKCVIPTVGLIVIMVLAPYFIDKAVAPKLATSENSILVVLIVGVITLVSATRLDNVRVDEVVIKFCLASNLVSVCDFV